jgi:predicted tellurium resistance membrane protein TerC
MGVYMKKNNQIIKNTSLIFLILVPIILIVLSSNGITLMNNTYVYIYVAIYVGVSVTYVLVTNKTCNWHHAYKDL